MRHARMSRHAKDWPPSTTIVCPVTQLARSLARNSATLAISSGDPSRPPGDVLESTLIELRVRRLAAFPDAAGKLGRPGGDGIDPDPLRRKRQPLAHGVVDQ